MQYINVCLLELKFIIDVIQNIGISIFSAEQEQTIQANFHHSTNLQQPLHPI